jgi:hypothetical protein
VANVGVRGLASAVRVFATPLVLESLRRNFVDALQCIDVRIFLQLKTADTAKELGPSRISFGVTAKAADVLRAALRQPWLAARLEDAVIVNGSGSVLSATAGADGRASRPQRAGADGRATDDVPVVAANDSAWWAYRARRCTL